MKKKTFVLRKGVQIRMKGNQRRRELMTGRKPLKVMIGLNNLE
jgi:hypothetical protein